MYSRHDTDVREQCAENITTCTKENMYCPLNRAPRTQTDQPTYPVIKPSFSQTNSIAVILPLVANVSESLKVTRAHSPPIRGVWYNFSGSAPSVVTLGSTPVVSVELSIPNVTV